MGSRTRTAQFTTYIEPYLKVAILKFCDRNDISYSEYIRQLVIKDLKDRGLLTDTMIAQNLC